MKFNKLHFNKPNFKNLHWNRYNWIAIFGVSIIQIIVALVFGEPQPIISLYSVVGILWASYYLDKSDVFERKKDGIL